MDEIDAVVVPGVDVGAVFDERPDHGDVASEGREVQRSESVGLRAHVDPLLDGRRCGCESHLGQQRHQDHIQVLVGEHVQQRVAAVVCQVDYLQ